MTPPEALTRRDALRLGASALVVATAGPPAATAAAAPARSRTTVQLLGTLAGHDVRRAMGSATRAGSSVLVRVDAALYLVDCGFGALTRLLQAGHEIRDLRHVLVTRHTVDHAADLGTALLLAWSSGRNAGGDNARRRLPASGPTGTVRAVRVLRRQQALSIYDQATALAQTPPFADYAVAHDVAPPRGRHVVVWEDDLVRITAHAAHAPGPPAVAYRIVTPDRDVVVTGSAGRRIDLATFAAGCDTIVYEVVDTERLRQSVRGLGLPRRAVHRLGVERAAPAAAADVASRAGARRLVLGALLPGHPDEARWRRLAGTAFTGELVVGRDLLEV